MKFIETVLSGAYVIEPVLIADARGAFARTFCRDEFTAKGLNSDLIQCNISFNKVRGTLRGMHLQTEPHQEAKLVRCTQGGIYDVIIDLRRDSPTFTEWFAVELSAANRRMLYVPEGFAHGFLTLSDETEVLYQMSEFYHSECSTGVRWDDPAFSIEWLGTVNAISDRDQSFPDFCL